MPQLLLHSDLHLESGPFTLPTASGVPEAPRVLVLAGDVGGLSGAIDAVPAIRALSDLPTVYVAGNHEFWGSDYFERLAQLRQSSQEASIHFLENNEVVLHGVRFLGATMWTDYHQGHDVLLHYGLHRMRDHQFIKAAQWWTAENKSRFRQTFGQAALEQFEGNFNPLLAQELHQRSRDWLKAALARPFNGPTVVVSHHAPVRESLLLSNGATETSFNKTAWAVHRDDYLKLTRVGSYASDVLHDLKDELQRADVRYWLHGHVHHALRFAVGGIQVASNPRGRVIPALTKEVQASFALLGMRFSDEDVAASQKRHRENPEFGDGIGYQKHLSLALTDTGYAVVAEAHQASLQTLEELLLELKELKPLSKSARAAVADLAGHRADTLWQAIVACAHSFVTQMATQLVSQRHIKGQVQPLDWLMADCHLGNSFEFSGIQSFADYGTLLLLKEAHREGPRSQDPNRYSALAHIRHVERMSKKFKAALDRAPAACAKLYKERRKLQKLKD